MASEFSKMLKASGIVAGSALAAGAVYLLESARTGVPELDRLEVRGRLVLEVLKRFGLRAVADVRIVRALMAIVHNESGGKPSNTLGDTSASGGPSIGFMQVYRSTAEDLGLWTPPAGATVSQAKQAYTELAGNHARGIAWGVAVFKDKLERAKGDIVEAVRRYNGSGPMAEAYRDKALAFATSKGWKLS
jgi:hypothetical protein